MLELFNILFYTHILLFGVHVFTTVSYSCYLVPVKSIFCIYFSRHGLDAKTIILRRGCVKGYEGRVSTTVRGGRISGVV